MVTKKEYQDICGVDFDDRAMQDRLQKTAYLYPKHVEVIEDFEPLVNQMVDDIVSAENLIITGRGGGGEVVVVDTTPLLCFLYLLHVINAPSHH